MMSLVVGRLVAAVGLMACVAVPAVAQKPYHVVDRWVIGGTGGWDYLTADSARHRLYVTHTTKVEVLDTSTGKSAGAITGLTRCHGVVISADGKTGFVSDGGGNAVVMFDTATLATTGKVATGTNPDGIAYEPVTNTVWAFNGGSKDVSVIDAAGKTVVATIALPGKPEFPQADGKGSVFVNIEDKNSIVRLDAKAKKATATWPLAGCESPSGMAIDASGMRLFSVCDGKKMVVADATTGKKLGAVAVGEGPDAAGYDAKDKLAFSSNGEGTLTVVDAGKAGYPVVQTLATEKSARTMAYDAGADRVYLATAKSNPVDAANPKARPTQVAGSFAVIVVGR